MIFIFVDIEKKVERVISIKTNNKAVSVETREKRKWTFTPFIRPVVLGLFQYTIDIWTADAGEK